MGPFRAPLRLILTLLWEGRGGICHVWDLRSTEQSTAYKLEQ